MSRVLPILSGLVVLLGAGIGHGLWTERWQRSVELEQAAERLEEIPTEIGGWTSEPAEQDPEALEQTGAVAHYSRVFTDPVSGENVLVILLCGRAGQMAVHRPEHCYRTAGYELSSEAMHLKVQPRGREAAEFWTGLFTRPEAGGPEQLRIFWSWFNGEQWLAPDNPRLTFARCRALYKLYVLRNVSGPTPLESDPCVVLLGRLLPLLDRILTSRPD